MEHYRFFQNQKCEYFPCHPGADKETFNCLFCYCPLYALGENCGGNFRYLENGVKDCTHCLRPHGENSYDSIMKDMEKILELAKNNRSQP